MRTFNQVILRGLVSDIPMVRNTTTDKKVANFVLMTFRTVLEDGKETAKADFHKITAWQSLADIAEKFLKKNSHIEILGELQNDNYKDKEGKIQYTNKINAERIDLLDEKEKETKK